MGSTVSTGKQAYAFVTPANRTAYVLFEEMYEKNCYPHHPSWSCVVVGYLDEVMVDLFRIASSCEGGMLQHRSGNVLPETYLERWLETLAEPMAMPDVTGTLAYGSSFYATLPLSSKDKIEASLRDHNLSDEVDKLLDGRDVSLHQDFDLLNAIYGAYALGAWRFITQRPFDSGIIRKDLGYSASLLRAQPKMAPPKMYRCGDDHVIVQNAQGEYKNDGWAYSVVGSFISDYVTHEQAAPGSFRVAFKNFRKATATAAQLNDETRIELTLGNEADSYDRERFEKMLNLFAPGEKSIKLTLGQVRQKEHDGPDSNVLYHLLNCRYARWYPEGAMQPKTQQLEAF